MIYTPSHFNIEDKNKVFDFICNNSFATLISSESGSVSNISKVPLMLKEVEGKLHLEGHFARLNPHWKYLESNPNVTVIFDGPHDYISPSWYQNTSKEVPTWNYSTVIVEGNAEVIDSQAWLLESVMEFSEKFEKDKSWKDSADKEYLSNLSRGIVGIKVQIEKIHSKFKLSQNKDEIDRNKVITELSGRNEGLASLMRSI